MLRVNSIDRLLLMHGLLSLILVAISAGIGGAMVYFENEASRRSIQETELQHALQVLRGDLYRQMKEVYDHVFINDPSAPQVFNDYSFRIETSLLKLEQLSEAQTGSTEIKDLQSAYHRIRTRAQVLMQRNPTSYTTGELFDLFSSDLEGDRIREYESALAGVEAAFQGEQRDTLTRLARLDWLLLPLLLGPVVLAAVLVLSARFLLMRRVALPLSNLMDATEAYAAGHLNHKVPEAGPAEFLALVRAVNHMARELLDSRQALLQSEMQATLGALVPVVAHNIRNPLASIRATAQLIDAPDQAAEVRDAVRGIVATVDRLNGWLTSLLSYLNMRRARRAPVLLAEIIDRAMDFAAHQAAAKSVRIERGAWDETAMVWGDDNLLEQAACGLVINAIEASPAGGHVTLSVRAEGESCLVSVEDEGPGMPFVAGASTFAPGPTTKSMGTGLGVPFARKVCEMHQGQLTFTRGHQRGTVASMHLPSQAPGILAAAQ